MKICCISDLHGYLPEIPDCDLLLIGGDICPVQNHTPLYQRGWLDRRFRPWLTKLSERMSIVAVAGNHDLLFERCPSLIPQDLPWTYLQDSGCEIGGLKIWGSPWQPRFFDWAFNLDEPQLAEKWALIPNDTDVLLLHGPPRGYGDWSDYGSEHCGSLSLLKRIQAVRPRLAVAGHIHGGYGRYCIAETSGKTTFINASYVNEQYKPTNATVVIEIPTEAIQAA